METMRMLTSLSNCGLSGAHLPERNSPDADLCGTHPEHICVKRYRHSICLHSGGLPRMTKNEYSSSEYSASAASARLEQQKKSTPCGVLLESGGDLLSRAVSSQVPSALKVLTSVFGMGTGGTPSPLPPEIVGSLFPHLDNCTCF